MKRALAAALLLCGCYKPNGKASVLDFGLEFPGGVATGLAQDVLLPQSHPGHFKGDFRGTALSAFGQGLTVLSQEHVASGAWRLRVLCDPTRIERTRELHVVLTDADAGTARYDDRYDLWCPQALSLAFSGVPSFIAVGAQVLAGVELIGADEDGKSVSAFGHGFSLGAPDASIEIDDELDNGGLLLEGLHAGACPWVRGGLLSMPLGCEVLDDAQWTLPVSVQRGAAGVTAVALPTGPDGGLVGVDPCELTLLAADGSPLAFDTSGNCTAQFAVDAGMTGQICAETMRHTTCSPF